MARPHHVTGRIALLMVGDELLDGRVRDTNSTFLLEDLAVNGVGVDAVVVLPDDVEAIAEAMRRLRTTSSVVLVTGGLGPTPDDLNREALSRVLEEPLQEDPAVVEAIRARFAARGGAMPASNRRQAQRPRSAQVIPNRHGTAPGLWSEDEQGRVLVLMPGVPVEMHHMWRDDVRKRVLARVGGRGRPRPRLRVTNVSESWLADRVAEVLAGESGVEVSYCVQPFGIDLLIDAQPAHETAVLDRLRDALGVRIYATGDRQLPEVVLDRLREVGTTLALAESCTGGLVAAMLTEVPGSSDVFRGAVVAYADAVKEHQLGVSSSLLAEHGAVSEPVVVAMAAGVRDRLAADWGVAVSGIAGPGGGTAEKPVGTIWVGLVGPEGERTRLLQLPGDRVQNRRWSAVAALDLLRRALA